MATSAIWITAVSMLSVFDISKAVGEDGEVIEPSYKYAQGVLMYAPIASAPGEFG